MKMNLSAKDFKGPLLRVLYEKTSGKELLPVDYDTTYENLNKLMGIDPTKLGINESSGKPMTEKWTQWAFKELVTEGFASRMGKGQWCLTVAGVKEAVRLNALPQTALPTFTDESDPESAVQVSSPSSDEAQDTFHSDAYIRAIAVKQTKCFGFRADQSAVCKSCTLGAGCQNAQYVELAKALKIEDDRLEAAKNAPKQPPVQAAAKPAGKPVASGGQARIIQSLAAAICNHCGKTVPKGEDAYWTRAPGGSSSSSSGGSGIYHVACYDPNK